MDYGLINKLIGILNSQDEQIVWSYVKSNTNAELLELFQKDLSNPYMATTPNGRYVGDIVGQYLYIGDQILIKYLTDIIQSNHLDFGVDILT